METLFRRKAGVTTATSDKTAIKTRSISRNKKEHFIRIKSSIPHNKPKFSCKKNINQNATKVVGEINP